ncbi:MAG: alpha/beta fold hydrolase [Actinomycetota bacterium]
MTAADLLTDEEGLLPGGPRLALRRAGEGAPGRPFLLVHGLASNAKVWDGVAKALAAAGREVAAVDLRGHGLSEDTPDTYSTEAAAVDLAALSGLLGWTGDRAPVVAGQSWGANVVLALAAEHGGVAAVACLDGGWGWLGAQFADFDSCWRALAPPSFDGTHWADVESWLRTAHPDWPSEGIRGTLGNLVELPDGGVRNRLTRAHHREILHSLWADDPRLLYPRVIVPVLLMPAGSGHGGRSAGAIAEALTLLPKVKTSEYADADHDLHAQHPERVAQDLLALDAWADGESA